MAAGIAIEPMSARAWEEVRAIYEEGLETDLASFEVEAPTWDQWDGAHLGGARLVARLGGSIAGWAALSPVSHRAAYGGVAEVSVYVGASHRGRGVGRALLETLVQESERLGLWTLQAAILAENEASVALHRICGFRVVGRRERIAQRLGVWRDVILMERRSAVVGT